MRRPSASTRGTGCPRWVRRCRTCRRGGRQGGSVGSAGSGRPSGAWSSGRLLEEAVDHGVVAVDGSVEAVGAQERDEAPEVGLVPGLGGRLEPVQALGAVAVGALSVVRRADNQGLFLASEFGLVLSVGEAAVAGAGPEDRAVGRLAREAVLAEEGLPSGRLRQLLLD